jgi:ABC-type Zn uptake system ZnuABC Zn-binding protein ZnuA
MQLQDFVRQVGGDRVSVEGILGPSDEPHEYEPTPDDADAVSAARVVVANGAELDGWLADLEGIAPDDAVRVTAVEGIELLPTEEGGFPGDPHVWHDPALAGRMVDNIAAGLSEADPEGRADYEENARRFKAELEEMAAAIRELFAPVPPEQRLLVTSHDAFGYFARAYDLTQVGTVLPSVTTETEPSARQIQRLVDEIRRTGVRAIFTEEAVDARLERRVAQEAGATVNSSLYADVLGEPGSGAETFIDAELANARAMAEAWSVS